MKFIDMQTMFQDILASPSTSVFTLTLIKSLINLSARNIYNRIVDANQDFFLTSGTISWVNGTEFYNLPNSGALNKIVLVERTDLVEKININPIDIRARNEFQKQQNILYTPRNVWFYNGAQIGFAPIPDTTATANITVWYVPNMADLVNDNDLPPAEWSADYHEVIVWGAINRAARRIKEPGDLYTDIYNELVSQLISMVAARQTQESHYINPPPDSDE
jgi:hypothetical protein